VVTFFQPEEELDAAQPMTKTDLLAMIEKAADAYLFSAVRVDGIFDEVRTRTVQRQTRPFPPHRSSEISVPESLYQRAGDLGRISFSDLRTGHRRGGGSPTLPALG